MGGWVGKWVRRLFSLSLFSQLTPPTHLLRYYRNADGCLIVFDLTRRPTFENVSKWVAHAKHNCGNSGAWCVWEGGGGWLVS